MRVSERSLDFLARGDWTEDPMTLKSPPIFLIWRERAKGGLQFAYVTCRSLGFCLVS